MTFELKSKRRRENNVSFWIFEVQYTIQIIPLIRKFIKCDEKFKRKSANRKCSVVKCWMHSAMGIVAATAQEAMNDRMLFFVDIQVRTL